ncbi:type II toxin-antitoxin system RelE/ParE family toxin [Dongia sp.]|uniref:type II toxin-antitoxin system RelE/ParE family toxin n=1 Tax=Dongia sp. TaxID=1977262 RepID=UPI003753E2D4
MRRLVLADAALADLRGIAEYTIERWGAAQKRRYLAALHAAVRRLRRNPTLGRNRPDLRRGYHTFLVARHVIFYRFDKDECEIVRILHDRMDMHRVAEESPER